jgi:predicted permease
MRMNPRELGRRVMARLSRRRVEQDLADEMRLHLDLRAATHAAAGAAPDEAERLARAAFGGLGPALEASLDAWGWRWLDEIQRACRFAVRRLRRSPAFATATVATLAIAIGVNIAIFSLVDRAVLHPLDVPNPGTLVTVQRLVESRGVRSRFTSMYWDAANGLRGLSTFAESAMASAAADRAGRDMTLEIDGRDPIRAGGRFVSANYFHVIGLAPALGRDFSAGDDTSSAPPTVMLSYRLWRTAFGADPEAIGRTVRLNNIPVVVIGVAARTFSGTDLAVDPPDIWLPLMTGSRLASNQGEQTNGRGGFTFGAGGGVQRPGFQPSAISPVSQMMLVARIAAGGMAAAQAELAARPESSALTIVPLADTMLPVKAGADLSQFLWLLESAVALTLLIGCANLAGLLLARMEDRRLELVVRAALGAARGRLVQEVVVEASLLAAAGGAAALVVAYWIDRGVSGFILPGGVPVAALRSAANGRTLLFAMAATAAAAMVIALAPVLRLGTLTPGLDIARARRGPARTAVTSLLVGVQVMVSLVLVFGAGLFVRSLGNALAVDVGFDTRGLMSAAVSVPASLNKSTILGETRALDAFTERARALPGVGAVTMGPLPLVQFSASLGRQVTIDGRPIDFGLPLDVMYTASNYFTTLRQPFVSGRDFDPNDREGSRAVAIVTASAARQFWPTGVSLDHQIGISSIAHRAPTARSTYSVIGIVRDVSVRNLKDAGHPIVYLARAQHEAYLAGYLAGAGSSFLILRVAGNPTALGQSLARAASDNGLSLQSITTVDQSIDSIVMPQRLGRTLLGVLGLVALVLTVVGVYGLVSCLVSRSSREISIRMALGARGFDVVRRLVSRALLPIAAGVVAGTTLAWIAGRMADRFMYGIRGSDPLTILVAASCIVCSGLLAALPALRRAMRIDPIEILKAE